MLATLFYYCEQIVVIAIAGENIERFPVGVQYILSLSSNILVGFVVPVIWGKELRRRMR